VVSLSPCSFGICRKKSIDATRVIEARVQLEANLAWMALIFNVRKQLSSLNDKIVRRRRV